MVNYEITKIQKIYEVCNEMAHNYYFIYYGKIYNENKTKFRRFKYVEWFDIFDVMEFFEKNIITKEDVKEYAHNLENSYLYYIKNYDDEKNLKEFYQYCNDTIKNFNSIL